MRKRNHLTSGLKDSVIRAFALPADLAYGSVLLSATIRIQAKDCRILIVGKRLQILYYTNDEMKIKGLIEQIIYEN